MPRITARSKPDKRILSMLCSIDRCPTGKGVLHIKQANYIDRITTEALEDRGWTIIAEDNP